MIGQTLGHYRIVDRLGSGGMGVVWLAEDLKLGRKVALKVLREDLAGSPEKAARFEREARAIAALSHPSIVTLHAVEEIDGERFLAMEHLEGRTLDQLVREGPLPLAELLRIAIPVAEALEAAHARGILHRDLKPSNVMVCTDGRVKVLDFGLAKLLEDPAKPLDGRNETTLTREGQVVGTLHYSSPEQLQQKPVDARTDIYSFGAVLYEMATGRVPFQGDSAAQVITAVLCDPPRRIDELEDRVPGQLADVVARCLEKSDEDRPASVQLVRSALQSVPIPVGSQERGRRARPLEGMPNSEGARRILWLFPLVFMLLGSMMIWRGSRREVALSELASVRAPSETRSRIAGPVRSVAVLPCVGSQDEPAYLLDGTTDALITALGSFRELRVISRQSILRFRRRPVETDRVSEELQVERLVDCRVVRTADRFWIDARVLVAGPGEEPWAVSFDADSQDLPELPAKVAAALAAVLLERRAPGPGKPVQTVSGINPEAYEQFLRGRFLEHRFDEKSVDIAESAYRTALEIDEAFADAWVGLAEILIFRSQFHGGGAEARAEASAAVARALAIDPDHGGALSAKAQLLADTLAWRAAEETVRRAIEIAPSSSTARRRYWMVLACQRRFPEALEQILAALRLDPLSARVAGNVGIQYWLMGDHDRAIEHLSRSLELDPSYTPAHAFLYGVYSELEKEPQRSAEFRMYLAGMGLSEVLPRFEDVLARSGFEEARRVVALFLADQPEVVRTRMGVVAGLLAESRETDRALRILEESLDRGSWEMIWSAASRDYRSLYGHPRFHRILQRLGLPQPPPESIR